MEGFLLLLQALMELFHCLIVSGEGGSQVPGKVLKAENFLHAFRLESLEYDPENRYSCRSWS